MPLNSPGGSTLQCDISLWDHNIEFARWQHPAMWQVALGWHAIEFAQTSAKLEFYIWFQFRPHHRSRHVTLHQSPKFYPSDSRRQEVTEQMWYAAEDCSRSSGDWKSSVAVSWESSGYDEQIDSMINIYNAWQKRKKILRSKFSGVGSPIEPSNVTDL